MTRREILALLAAQPLAAEPIHYRNYPQCLPNYLRRLANEAYERRVKALDALKTPQAIRERQRWAREQFWRLIGGQPERTPLNTRVTGAFTRKGYRVENLVFEGRPGRFVSANLYIPSQGNGPFPAVLFQMGHSPNGKAADTYQRCCQGLVQLGYLVLAFDPMGQGERVNYPQPGTLKTRLQSTDHEHTVPGRQMLLVGDTASRMQAWDAVRALDVLASHPQADPKRLASTGQSGGATLTMMLSAIDDRLAVAAVSSGNTESFACKNFLPPGSTDDAEQDFVGSGRIGFDRWDLLYPFAPKPLLVMVSAKDWFGTYSPNYESNGREEYDRLARIYERLGHADQLAFADSPLPHGLAYPSRLEIYRFFARWLQGSKPPEAEPPTEPEPEKTLWASPNGSVQGKRPIDEIREGASRIQTPETPTNLTSLLQIELKQQGGWKVIRRAPYLGCAVEAIEAQSAPEVWVPAWRFEPKQPRDGSTLVILDPSGRNAAWQEGGLYQRLATQGVHVIAPDLRGIGDLAPEVGPGAPAYTKPHASEEDYAWASLILGRNLLGQRVEDILAIISAQQGSIALAARGKLAIPALFAAALERRIKTLYLAGGLLSYRSLANAEDYVEPLANFLPNVLRSLDLPQLAQSLSHCHVIIAGALDGSGKRADEGEIRKIYGAKIQVRAQAAWDVPTLGALV